MKRSERIMLSVIAILFIYIASESVAGVSSTKTPAPQIQTTVVPPDLQKNAEVPAHVIIATNLQYAAFLLACVAIFFTGLSVTVVFLAYKREKRVEVDYEKFKNEMVEKVTKDCPKVVLAEVQSEINKMAEKIADQSTAKFIEYYTGISNDIRKSEMQKDHSIVRIMQSLFSIVENKLIAIAPQSEAEVNTEKDIRVFVTKHFLDMNNLIYLFSPESNTVEAGLMYFIEHPNPVISKSVIDIIRKQHRYNLDIISEVRQLEEKLGSVIIDTKECVGGADHDGTGTGNGLPGRLVNSVLD